MTLIQRLILVNNIKTSNGCLLCSGCGKPIPVGQEYWDDIELPWHTECVPVVEKEVDSFLEMDI